MEKNLIPKEGFRSELFAYRVPARKSISIRRSLVRYFANIFFLNCHFGKLPQNTTKLLKIPSEHLQNSHEIRAELTKWIHGLHFSSTHWSLQVSLS
jgi:hypothetical protein